MFSVMTKQCSRCKKSFENNALTFRKVIKNKNRKKLWLCSVCLSLHTEEMRKKAYLTRLSSETYRIKRRDYVSKNREKIWLQNAALPNRYARSKSNAKSRGLDWNISLEEYSSFLALPCTYCNKMHDSIGIGLDRLDNAKGYEPNNVVPACGVCNISRGDYLTHEEMQVFMKAIIKYRSNKSEDKDIPSLIPQK